MKKIFKGKTLRRMFTAMALVMLILMGIPAALSANKDVPRSETKLESYLVEDNVHIYKGALICINSSGYVAPAADTSGYTLAGIAYEECDNTLTGHSQGGKSVRAYREGKFKLGAIGTITQANVGDAVYARADDTVATSGTNSVLVGLIVEYVSSTVVWVDIAARLT